MLLEFLLIYFLGEQKARPDPRISHVNTQSYVKEML